MPGLTRARRAGTPTVSRPLTPEHLGRIVVARFLELPLRTFERRVRTLEQAPRFQDLLRDAVRIGSLSGRPSVTARQARGEDLLGMVQRAGESVVFHYASAAFDREYAFEEVVLARLMARGDLELTRLVSRLRLVNTRNRLTHALVQTLIETQGDYVPTGDPLRLGLLSQAALSARIRARGACSVDADPSRVSRLLRHLAVRLPGGEVVRLRSLCPVARDLQRRYVSWVIQQERVRMVEDRTLAPMTDRGIAAAVREAFGARLLTRTVAYIRCDLGIPGSRERERRSEYLSVTVGFSPVLSLTAESLHEQVPPGSGVYEIRRAETPPGMCPIIYIGSARDLRKRLGDHLRGWSDNALLQAHARGGMRFRYRPVAARWRDFERAVYQAFCATFGTPPLCNRMSP